MMRSLIAMLCLVGIVVSVLALRVHYSTGAEPCSINARWDCGVVNHSPFAMMGPVPVAAIGILGYLALAGLGWTRQRFPLFLAVLVDSALRSGSRSSKSMCWRSGASIVSSRRESSR